VDVIPPMLATSGQLPRDDGWAFEFKWDGVRAVTYLDHGRLTLLSRSGRDMTTSYPELGRLAEAMPVDEVVLDGELIAFAADGRPDFGTLQARMHVQRPRPDLLRAVPVSYLVFDRLVWDGRGRKSVEWGRSDQASVNGGGGRTNKKKYSRI
jgi:bifunctional non-homologous end joining protein LigD